MNQIQQFIAHIDYIHLALVALAILGPIIVKVAKDRGHAQIAAVLDAVIRGVEDHYDATGDQRVKDAIKDRATVEGVEPIVNAIVKKATDGQAQS